MSVTCLGSGISLKSYAAGQVQPYVGGSNEDLSVQKEGEGASNNFQGTGEGGKYAIYPIPQNIVYGGGSVSLNDTVAIVKDKDIDEHTVAYVKEILDLYNINYNEFGAIQDDKINIILALENGSLVTAHPTNGNITFDKEVSGNNINITTGLLDKSDAHVVDVRDNRFIIYGRDTDSVFHGVATLKMMFSSFNGEQFPEAHIEDYAVVDSRGFIEGFYGAWNHQARMDLMKFAKDYKMNSYIYAAKQDTYHTSQWAALYPDNMLNEFKELVKVGEETKVKFGWSVHTGSFFRGIAIPSDAYETRYDQLMKKFDQLIGIGVKRFDILNDDFGAGDNEDVVAFLNRVNEDLKKKGCESITFCPQGYNKAWANAGQGYPELTAMKNLSPDIKLYWTGDDVNAPITQETVTLLKEKSDHDPDFWLNYPVNEHAKKGMFLGHIKHYARDGVTGMAGFHSNPNRYPYASQVGLYQLAALVWNNNNFVANAEKIWESAFDYLQPEVAEEYFTIANHISNAPQSSRVGNAFPESDRIEQELDKVKMIAATGQPVKDLVETQTLLKEFDEVLAAITEFNNKCSNEALVAELTPWLNSLNDIVTAAKLSLEVIIHLEENNLSEAWGKMSLAGRAYDMAYTYKANSDSDSPEAKAGSKRLEPFVSEMITLGNDLLTPIINPDSIEPRPYIRISGQDRMKEEETKKVYDGNDETAGVWNSNQQVGDYVGIDLGKVTKVTDIRLLQGNNDTDHDILHQAVLQYSEDGVSWNDLEPRIENDGHLITLDGLEIEARYVRYYLTATGMPNKPDYWTHIREFTVNKDSKQLKGDKIYTNLEQYKETPVTYEGTTISIRDLNSLTLAKDEYVGIKLLVPTLAYEFELVADSEEQQVQVLDILDNPAAFNITETTGLILEYSYNEVEWIPVTEETVNVPFAYLRLINKTENDITINLEKLEAGLTLLEARPELLSSTMNGGIGNGSFETVFDGDRSTSVQTVSQPQNGNYMTFELGRNAIQVHDVTVVTTDGSETFTQAKIQVSADNSVWTDIGTINNNMNMQVPYKLFTCDGEGIQAKYLRILITANSSNIIKLHEIEINANYESGQEAARIVTNLPGNGNAAIDGKLSTSLSGKTTAGTYVEYKVHDNTNVEKVSVVMGKGGSGKAYVVTPDGDKELGTLSESITEFAVSDNDTVLAVKLTWDREEDVAIHEIGITCGPSLSTDIGMVCEPVYLDGGEGAAFENIAIGKAVAASGSSYNLAKENVNDGVQETKWDSNPVTKNEGGTETAWISIDLGEETVYEVSKLILYYHNLIWPTKYSVQISQDGSVWTKVGETYKRDNSNSLTYPVDTIEFETPIVTRYVRINYEQLNSHAAGAGIGVKEFEIYGRPYTLSPITEKAVISQGQPVEVSGTSNGTKEKINDGNDSNNSKWDSNYIKGTGNEGNTAWFSIDLGEKPVLIDEVYVHYFNKVYPTVYSLQVSHDNIAWHTVKALTKEHNGQTYPEETIVLETPVHARYVRMFFEEMNSAAAGHGIGITEAKVYGRIINTAASIVEIAKADDINLEIGANINEVKLPELVSSKISIQGISTEESVLVPVDFDAPVIDTSVDGKYLIEGTLLLNGISNTDNKKLSFNILVGNPADPEILPVLDYSILEAYINGLEVEEEAVYTEESYGRYQEALNDAIKLLEDKNAVNQEEVDEALTKLEEVVSMLEKKQTTPDDGGSGSDNDDGSGSDNDDGSGSDNDSGSGSDNDGPVYKEGIWADGLKEEYSYTGAAIKPEIYVYDGDRLLIEKKDYTLVHKNNKIAYDKAEGDEGYDSAQAPYVEIKMKGNHSGSKKLYYKIIPVDLTETHLEADKLTAVVKSGKVATVTPVLYWQGKKLKLNRDYTVEGSLKNLAEGTKATIRIDGINNFTGSFEDVEVVVTADKNADGKTVVSMSKVSVKNYQKSLPWAPEGATQEEGFTVNYKKNGPDKNEYVVTYSGNDKVGTAYMILTGTGKDINGDGYVFVGTKTIPFKVTGITMSKKTVTVNESLDRTYNDGKPILPTKEVKEDGKPAITLTTKGHPSVTLMEEGTHYTVSYSKNIEKGTASVTFKGIEEAGFTGTYKVSFKITPKSVKELNIEVPSISENNDKKTVLYTKGTTTPAVVVTTAEGRVLEAGKDYTVSYKNNKKIGQEASVIVKGKGNYADSETINFIIERKELSNDNGIRIVVKDKVSNGKANNWSQSVKVLDSNGKALSAKDYDKKNMEFFVIRDGKGNIVETKLDKSMIVEENSIIEVRVKGIGDYAAKDETDAVATGTYRILKKGYDISKATIKLKDKDYTGAAVEITSQDDFVEGKVFLTIEKGNKKVLELGKDIEVVEGSYEKNIAKGTARVTFRGMEGTDFGGTRTVTFKIKPATIDSRWWTKLTSEVSGN